MAVLVNHCSHPHTHSTFIVLHLRPGWVSSSICFLCPLLQLLYATLPLLRSLSKLIHQCPPLLDYLRSSRVRVSSPSSSAFLAFISDFEEFEVLLRFFNLQVRRKCALMEGWKCNSLLVGPEI